MKRGVLIIAGLAVLLVIIFVIVTLLGRGGQTAQDQILSVYLPFDEEKTYQEISAEFLASNSNTKLEFKYIDAKDAKDYEAKVVNEIADGAGPDIWLMRSDWIPKHAAKSVVYASTEEAVANLKTLIEPAVVDLNTFDGKAYGVPLFADTLAIFYNRTAISDISQNLTDDQVDELRADPLTWEIVKRQAELATKKTGNVIQTSGLALGTVETGYAPVDVYSALLLQQGGRLFSEDQESVALNLAQFENGKSSFPATNALNLFASFSKTNQKNYSWNNDLGSAAEAFKSGKAVAIIGYRSLLKEILDSKPKFSVDVAALPQLTDNRQERVDYGVSWTHVINANSTNQALAKSYLDYLTGLNVQVAYADATGKTSVDITDGPAVGLDGLADSELASDTFRSQLRSITQLHKPEWQRIDEIVQDMLKAVTTSGQSAQSAVDSAAARLKDLL